MHSHEPAITDYPAHVDQVGVTGAAIHRYCRGPQLLRNFPACPPFGLSLVTRVLGSYHTEVPVSGPSEWDMDNSPFSRGLGCRKPCRPMTDIAAP